MSNFIAVDIETTGLSPETDDIIGCSVCYGEGLTEYFDFKEDELEELSYFLANEQIIKVFHNASFDTAFLRKFGFAINGEIRDTLAMASLVDENVKSFKLKELIPIYLGEGHLDAFKEMQKWLSDNKKTGASIGSAPKEILLPYCMEDAENTYKLYVILKEKLIKSSRSCAAIKLPLTPKDYFLDEIVPFEAYLSKLNSIGLNVNLELIKEKEEEYKTLIESDIRDFEQLMEAEINQTTDAIYEKEKTKRVTEKGKANVKYPKFQISSGAQISEVFFNYGGLRKLFPETTKSGKHRTDEPYLSQIAASLSEGKMKRGLAAYLEYKGKEKLLSTYILGIKERTQNGRIYPKYLQFSSAKDVGNKESTSGGTITGRLSCKNPNMQNLPRKYTFIKRFFIPNTQNKTFFYADYSQIELRVAAHLSQEPVMRESFNLSEDLHSSLAKLLFEKDEITKEERQIGKTMNFLLIYGGSWRKLQQTVRDNVGIELTDATAKLFREKYFERYPRYAKFLEECKSFLKRYHVAVSMFGRVRHLPDLKFGENLDYKRRKFDERFTSELYFLQKTQYKDKQLFDIAARKFSHAINQGVNFPVQSAAASIVKRAMLALDKAGYQIVMQVHDSVVIQLDKAFYVDEISTIVDILENTTKLSVPLKVDWKMLNSLDEKDVYEN